jgi:hypothetical protein
VRAGLYKVSKSASVQSLNTEDRSADELYTPATNPRDEALRTVLMGWGKSRLCEFSSEAAIAFFGGAFVHALSWVKQNPVDRADMVSTGFAFFGASLRRALSWVLR